MNSIMLFDFGKICSIYQISDNFCRGINFVVITVLKIK